MTELGIISDTHDNLPALDKALEEFERRGIRTIIHAGDIIAPFTLRRILAKKFAFKGVFGNNDGEIALLSRVAQEGGALLTHQPLLLEQDNLKILVMHGIADPQGTKELVTRLAASNAFNVVVYGHTHEVDVRKVGKTLVINPGEACGYLTGRRTIAILELEKLKVEIVEF